MPKNETVKKVMESDKSVRDVLSESLESDKAVLDKLSVSEGKEYEKPVSTLANLVTDCMMLGEAINQEKEPEKWAAHQELISTLNACFDKMKGLRDKYCGKKKEAPSY